MPGNSRNELAKTICEHLHGYNPRGQYRKDAALRVREQLEGFGILTLLPKRNTIAGKRSPIVHTKASEPGAAITGTLSDLEPLWRALVDRHHSLGCPRPFGSSLHGFVVDAHGRRLGCLLFEAGSRQLPTRDAWIGWTERQREQRLHLVVQNSRFLLFPWVRIQNLASKVLAMVTSQLVDEWERRYPYRPVLMETFVDPTHFDGASYKAANWTRIGRTAGKRSGTHAKPAKDIYVQPLTKHFRDILKGTTTPKTARPTPVRVTCDDPFVAMWQPLIGAITPLAHAHDQRMIKRHRTLNSLLIILFVFRLVLAPRTIGYTIILAAL